MSEHAIKQEGFQSFAEFYPFYLEQHSNATCRRLHVVGSTLILMMIGYVLFSGTYSLLLTLPIIGYGFAWVGHFGFEQNKPATFTHPIYSFMGDWVMCKDVISGKISW